MTLTQILLRDKIIRAIINLMKPSEETKTITYIAKNSNLIHSYTMGLVKVLKANKLLSAHKTGRCVELVLTTKGYKVAKRISKLYYKLQEIDDPKQTK